MKNHRKVYCQFFFFEKKAMHLNHSVFFLGAKLFFAKQKKEQSNKKCNPLFYFMKKFAFFFSLKQGKAFFCKKNAKNSSKIQ
jgi:hypothetical protein